MTKNKNKPELAEFGELPINSVAIVYSASNEEAANFVRNLINELGISTCLQIELPVSKSTNSPFLYPFIIKIDKLLSRFLPGSRVPDINQKSPYCPWITMEDFVSYPDEFLIKIDYYILIGHDDKFYNILPAELKRPIFKLTLGSINDGARASFGLTEMLIKALTVSLRLELIDYELDKNIFIEMAVQTHYASATHTKSSLLANLRDFFLPAMFRLESMSQHTNANSLNSDNRDKPSEALCWRKGIIHIARLINAIFNRFFYKYQWFMAFTTRSEGEQDIDWTNLIPLLPTADKLWADPFIVSHDGHDWLFFEEAEYLSSKGKEVGHISVVKINESGFVGPVKRALDVPWHLSYPNVFEFEDEWYMIPESGFHGKVELYKCVKWPDKWKPYLVLLDDYAGYDASLFQDKGIFYMFVARRADGCATTDFLDLFWSSSPLGPWLKHKLSPIIFGVDCARPGGRPFVNYDGRKIRPAQDSSGGIFGRSLKFQTIVDLSESEFSERTDQTLEPNVSHGIYGVHSYSSTEKIVVIDLLRRVPRFYWMTLLSENLPSVLVNRVVSNGRSVVT